MIRLTPDCTRNILITITIVIFLIVIVYGTWNPSSCDWSPKLSVAALVIMITLVVFYYHFDSSRWTE